MRMRLANSVLWGGALGLGYLIYDSPQPFDTIYLLGLAIAVLSIYPLYYWAKTMKHQYPVFEILIATHLGTYAIPIISGQAHERLFTEATLLHAATSVVLFLLAAYAGFYLPRPSPRHTQFWKENLFRQFPVSLLSIALVLTTSYVLINSFVWQPPASLVGIFRAASFGITTIAIFMLTMQWGRGELPPRDRLVLTLCISVQFIILSTSLILRSGSSLILLGLIGFFFGAKRIPWLTVGITFLVLAVLHNGKNYMRQMYWVDGLATSIQLTEIPEYYLEWTEAGFKGQQTAEAKSSEVTANSTLLERSSLIQMLCLVIENSPQSKPFLNGETYGHILGQFVPRILWPDKPRGHISTYRLSIYYGLQDEHATKRTTIAFGMLPEAYANFGTIGIIGLGVIVGLCYSCLLSYSRYSPLFSPAGLLIILLTAWSFQTELTLSAWLGSLFQAVVSLMGMLFVFRRLL